MSTFTSRYVLWVGLLWSVGCVDPTTTAPDDGGITVDTTVEPAIEDAAADPFYDQIACANRPPPPTVPECIGCPGERPGANCLLPQPDGGIYGRCRQDGELISGKVLAAYCCNHADAGSYIGHIITSKMATDAGACIQNAPDDILICAVCGDGVCATWENHCNCPADCP